MRAAFACASAPYLGHGRMELRVAMPMVLLLDTISPYHYSYPGKCGPIEI